MDDNEDQITERIFTCLQRLNLKMIAQVLQEWELTDANSNIILNEDMLWSRGKENLIRAYQDLKDDHSTNECSISDGRLVAVCLRDGDSYHFQLEFILCRSESRPGEG